MFEKEKQQGQEELGKAVLFKINWVLEKFQSIFVPSPTGIIFWDIFMDFLGHIEHSLS